MATVRRFQDLVVWQKARELSLLVFQLSLRSSWPAGKLKVQILDSSASCAPNIAEGFERGGNAEFVSFLGIAKGSAGETSSHLYEALDRGYITGEDHSQGVTLATEVCNLAGGLISYLERSGLKGPKFRHRPSHPKTTNPKPQPNSEL